MIQTIGSFIPVCISSPFEFFVLPLNKLDVTLVEDDEEETTGADVVVADVVVGATEASGVDEVVLVVAVVTVVILVVTGSLVTVLLGVDNFASASR